MGGPAPARNVNVTVGTTHNILTINAIIINIITINAIVTVIITYAIINIILIIFRAYDCRPTGPYTLTMSAIVVGCQAALHAQLVARMVMGYMPQHHALDAAAAHTILVFVLVVLCVSRRMHTTSG